MLILVIPDVLPSYANQLAVHVNTNHSGWQEISGYGERHMTYKMLILDTKEELVAKGIQRVMKLRENNS